ncbi:MAG: recombinase family protein [Reyranella sp.]|uniref:recombinase family protein n=1 Tax=Reyranella sp. TaxID=1929291 RepID=UPI00121267DF|nr:recombinase family protein [Reyranella sp.]TAJ41396.1 MAG: recombinase family protein [Reyranella sp.]
MAKRVAVYVRVSTGSQTVENQERELRAVAAQAGWRITKVYADRAISGGKSREERPAFRELCDDAVRRKFDTVAAWSIDRLSRNLQNLLDFVAELQALGVGLYLYRQNIDTSTPAGRAMFQMCGVFGELEKSVNRERVVAGLDRARAEGKKLGRPRIDPEIEERIKAALIAGDKGIKKIAKTLGVGTGTVQRVKMTLTV